MTSNCLLSFSVAWTQVRGVIRPQKSTYFFTINELLLHLISLLYARKGHRFCFATVACRGVDLHFEGVIGVPICLFLSWDCQFQKRRWRRPHQRHQTSPYASAHMVVIAELSMASVRVRIVTLDYSHYDYYFEELGCWRGWYNEQASGYSEFQRLHDSLMSIELRMAEVVVGSQLSFTDRSQFDMIVVDLSSNCLDAVKNL